MTIERGQVIDPTRPITAHIKRLYADQADDACRNRFIRVVIYPTTAALQAAAAEWSRQHGHTNEWDNTGGCFHPTEMSAKYDRRKKQWIDTTKPYAGLMRLSQEYLNPEVIAHEAAHAALHVTRLHDWSKPGNDGNAHFDSCDATEEAFAYLLGGIVGELTLVADQVRALAKKKGRN